MILDIGEKVHVVLRRVFADDLRRHFVGTVDRVEGALARVKGHIYIYDTSATQFVKRPHIRVQIFALSDSGNIITLLPPDTVLENVEYKMDENRRLILTDGEHFGIDINEFSARY
jgi:hypothetical protein